jgi:hypothetical protein
MLLVQTRPSINTNASSRRITITVPSIFEYPSHRKTPQLTLTPNPRNDIALFPNGLEYETTLPRLLCGLDGSGGVGNAPRSTLLFGVTRIGVEALLGKGGALRLCDLPTDDLRAIDIRDLPIESLRLRSADIDFLRDVWPMRGEGRSERDSVQGGRAVTPMGGWGRLVLGGTAVCGREGIRFELT